LLAGWHHQISLAILKQILAASKTLGLGQLQANHPLKKSPSWNQSMILNPFLNLNMNSDFQGPATKLWILGEDFQLLFGAIIV
jgi:hypothetical protein